MNFFKFLLKPLLRCLFSLKKNSLPVPKTSPLGLKAVFKLQKPPGSLIMQKFYDMKYFSDCFLSLSEKGQLTNSLVLEAWSSMYSKEKA
jgi:hypothetical protein